MKRPLKIKKEKEEKKERKKGKRGEEKNGRRKEEREGWDSGPRTAAEGGRGAGESSRGWADVGCTPK